MNLVHYGRALAGIMRRELLRMLRQRGRLAAAIVRPLVWLAIFAAGFRNVLGLSIIPPYESYILYEVYIVPGLLAMMLLFHGMQNSLSMVYDREMGSMRTLLVAPLPRWYLLGARLLANAIIAVPLVYVFLLIARWWGMRPPLLGYLAVLPAIIAVSLMLSAFGLLVSSLVRQLENFAGVMNFVIFPVFFASTALYPLWRLEDVDPVIAWAAWLNPFSHAVELIRFALYVRLEPLAGAIVSFSGAAFFAFAVWGFDPGRGFWARQAQT
jgi:ABC-2 type transport system permease protein